LGLRVGKFISRCGTRQRVKHPKRSFPVQNLSHLPTKPGEPWLLTLMAVTCWTLRVSIYIYMFRWFSKFVKLYPLKAATNKACLNKILNDDVVDVTRPKCILSDNGTQFASKNWRNKLADMKTDVIFAPIRHPQANPSERCMREIRKFCRIYCHEAHKRWPELLSHIQG